ncbi:MAG: hypothetical protein DCF19_19775 [Pseudanabaena frigida]|uniref:Uncharacterized protein n=1 Tax=Pseudanabaena frigida TaxID=945775 RepID=A0A2W4Y0T4_9CYAN|nr:MAG: hypothetical protein DCF19_19775 [Pseudanabaena frigida]
MDLPMYCIVGRRPVKLIATETGGTDVLAYNWETGEFQREMSYLTTVLMGEGEVDYVSEQEFNSFVTQLQNKK